MASEKVRGDHEVLATISSSFKAQADETQKTISNLQKNLDTLQNDWIGNGGNAFRAEMSSTVMPTFKRLQKALSEAGAKTAEISQIIKQAEEDSSNVFHL
jgi:WXG100 family type VII secretion target